MAAGKHKHCQHMLGVKAALSRARERTQHASRYNMLPGPSSMVSGGPSGESTNRSCCHTSTILCAISVVCVAPRVVQVASVAQVRYLRCLITVVPAPYRHFAWYRVTALGTP